MPAPLRTDGHLSGTLNEMVMARQKKFLVELIKPSHYDDQGYIIQWWRGFVPSNSLSCLYGLALDVSERRALGNDVVDIEVHDETNAFVPVKTIIRRFAENENRGLVCLVGVQTNQFARAVDIARELRAAGIQVAIGGFHVSGCLAMLPALTPELKEALALGITLFAGEAEGGWRRFSAPPMSIVFSRSTIS